MAFPEPPGALFAVDGRRLHLLARGNGAPTVVLIAGGGMPGLYQAPLLERVSAFTRACLYDRAGMAWSDPPAAPRSFEGHAEDLHGLLAAAGERAPFVLVGESYGGLVARAFAARWPSETAGLVLVDSAEEGHVFEKVGLLAATGRGQLRIVRLLSALGLLRPLARLALPPIYRGETRARLAAILGRPAQWAAMAGELEAYALTPEAARQPGGFGRLPGKPLVVIAHGRPFRGPQAGLEDGWRAGQERLAALSERGRLVVAEACGHTIAIEAPDLVAAEVRRIVEAVRQGA